MTIDLNRLKNMSQKELIDLAQQTNAPHHHKNSKETLIDNIINKVMESTLNTPEKEKTQKAADVKIKEPVFLSEQELEATLAPTKERQKAFSTSYDHEARCVVLIYNDGRYKHSETMSLSCPLSKFKRKAAEIAKGPLLLPTHRPQDWGRLGAGGKNAYTEVVLG